MNSTVCAPSPTQPEHLLQDCDRKLSEWFASRPEARMLVRQRCAEIRNEYQQELHMNNDTRIHLRAELKRIENVAALLNQTLIVDKPYDEAYRCVEDAEIILSSVQENIDEFACEEDEKYSNMPEGLQNSDRGQAVADAAENLHQAWECLDTVLGKLAEYTDADGKSLFGEHRTGFALEGIVSDMLDELDDASTYIADAMV